MEEPATVANLPREDGLMKKSNEATLFCNVPGVEALGYRKLIISVSISNSRLGDKVALKTNGCNGSIAECNEEYEFVMPSHVSERYLEETKKYISPGTLKPDQPVCNGGASGQSYSSSCLPPPSNPPSRGCSKYYRCRSDD
ncbi:hypothetical protein OIU84_025043 [Salix udensis]|uniref:Uncharacterized protein n=1 Tax=Salix udensis TaxID=889485 RepID=A0AAD6PBD5_9ROSI|nr:hypothetical protein OIU84_025043 [Salix udensis]